MGSTVDDAGDGKSNSVINCTASGTTGQIAMFPIRELRKIDFLRK